MCAWVQCRAALRCGADLATVICTPDAAGPIKSYSPELMVAPYLPTVNASADDLACCLSSMICMLDRVHTVVVGPVCFDLDEFAKRDLVVTLPF